MDQMDYEVDLLEMVRVLWQRKWGIMAIVIVSMVVAYCISSNMARIYKATSLIMVRPDPALTSISFLQDAASSPLGSMRNYVEYIKSRTLTEATLARLGWLQSSSEEEVLLWQGSISVQQVQGTDLARLSVECNEPEKATAFINTLVEEFQERIHQMNQESTGAAMEFITQQLAIAENDLKEAEGALLEYKETSGIVELSDESKTRIDRLANINQLLSQTEIELQAATSEQQELEEILRGIDPTLIASTTLVNSPIVQQHRVRLSELETDLVAALEQYTENNPTVVALRTQINHISAKLAEEVERVIGSETTSLNPIYQDIRSRLVSGKARIVALGAKLEALEKARSIAQAELESIPKMEIDLARLVRNQRVNEEIYVMLRSKYEEMRISESMKVSDVYVIDKAIMPDKPIKPRKLLNTAIAGILGMFVAVGYAFVLEYTDTTIKSPEEAERILELPTTGVVPDLVGARVGARQLRRTKKGYSDNPNGPLALLTSHDPRSPGTEAFGIIRTHLDFASQDNSVRSILVCSPGSEEGRSVIAANLGISLARTGKSVILVDADMRKPTQHMLFSLPNTIGFAQLLANNVDQEIAQETEVPGLKVITSGPIPPNPSDVLSSHATMAAISAISSQADVVIYDTPPLTTVPDAMILGARLDGALMVVRLGVTSREAAKRSKKLLRASRSRVLGVVVNAVARRR